ncbi:MAG: DUF1045 domain-containing protein [Deltaproteobacteria bacterium]|jgi:hypothetical protein|nr:DUF1045 domain-containing protein [Deltaproteobacteria bacterium]
MTERFSVYYTPDPKSPLYRIGSAILGYCVHSGESLKPPWPSDLTTVVSRPLKAAIYGFHATMVAPFRSLAPAERLARDLESLAKKAEAIELGSLEVTLLEPGFPALIPKTPNSALHELEARLVESFAPYIAPLTPDDLARREPLSERQRILARKWGYPYVLDEFRFHLTLGDPLTDQTPNLSPKNRECLEFLRSLFSEDILTISLDRLCLCQQSSKEAAFKVIFETILKTNNQKRGAGAEGM